MTETLYEHAGGDEAHRLEEAFYAKALSDPVLKDVFTERNELIRPKSDKS